MFGISFADLALSLIVLLIGFAVAVLAFEILMIISAVNNKNISDQTRTVWIIAMLLIHPFAAIAYYFTDHKKNDNYN